MVGIVVVSHSRALARAAVVLAEQMLQGRPVPIVIAAGTGAGPDAEQRTGTGTETSVGDDQETFGTDATRIAEALVEADDGDGVIVLMDLGSAVLSAELALELLEDDELRQRVLLCPAPLVEGLVVAAVTAGSGAGRAEVAAEAIAGLAGKQSQLDPSSAAAPPVRDRERPVLPDPHDQSAEPDRPDAVVWFRITPEHGLHARPAARLVQTLLGLDARVELRNRTAGSSWVPGSSLSRLATLGALPGHDVEIRASGPQASTAVERVLDLARRNFDERAALPEARGDGSPGRVTAIRTAGPAVKDHTAGPFPASPGIGIGPARPAPENDSAPITGDERRAPGGRRPVGVLLEPGEDPNPGAVPEEPAAARQRLDAAIEAVRTQVQQIRARVARDINEDEAAIFDAHLALLADPELLEAARSRISTGQPAGSAWANAVSVAAAGYESLTDPYLQARAADVRALGNQVALYLRYGDGLGRTDERNGVLIAADLTPTEAATLDSERVTAVVLAFGSPSAHSTILIRARGIPAVVGAGPAVLRIADGTPLAVDGSTGELILNPAPAVVTRFRERATAAKHREHQALARAGTPAATRDGLRVLVGANLGSMEDARAAMAAGADRAGLVRTEFLFLGRAQAPEIDEQEAAYRGLAETLAGKRITLRTLDVGGDKPLPYLPQPAEANPFLGVRGLRLARRRPQLLADQLIAVIRVAHDVPVSVMFPMVSTLDEVLGARRILDDAVKQVGRGEPVGLQVGIMIEVPAAALKAATLARYVDFLSLGTNDLTQYTLAAERGNDALASLADPLDPGVLRLIDVTCRGAAQHHIQVAVCGELAADEQAVALLVGLGVRELSVTPRAIPGIKEAVRLLTLPGAEALAARALDAPSAAAVRNLLARRH